MRIRAPLLALAPLLLAAPLASGCFTSVGFCCGRLSDGDELTRGDRREVKKELRNEERARRHAAAERFWEGAQERREKDVDAYVAFVAGSLALARMRSEEPSAPGVLRAVRVTPLDGFASAAGLQVSARVETVPDAAVLVERAARAVHGDALSGSRARAIGRDLWLAERLLAAHLPSGVPGVEVSFIARAVDGGGTEIALGTARTDAAGRAVLVAPVPPSLAPGVWQVEASLAGSVPPSADGLSVESDPAAHLFVRAAAPPGRVVFVSADAVLDQSRAARRERWFDGIVRPLDHCTADALRRLSEGGIAAVIVSAEPDRMAGLLRTAATRAGIELPANTRVVFAPEPQAPGGAASAAERLVPLLRAQTEWWGERNAVGFVGVDPDRDAVAATRAGIDYLGLPRPSAGGWCAGVASLLPPEVPR